MAPTDLVGAAQAAMQKHRFRHVPVTEDGRLVGIVSDRDLHVDPGTPLRHVMQRRLVTVSGDTPVEVAAGLMLDNKIGCLPVVDGEQGLGGIVTETDLFRYLTTLLRGSGPSTRVELRLADLPSQLALVTRLANDCRVPIASLITEPEQTDGGRRVVLRVGSIDVRAFLAALHEASIEVIAPALPTPVLGLA